MESLGLIIECAIELHPGVIAPCLPPLVLKAELAKVNIDALSRGGDAGLGLLRG